MADLLVVDNDARIAELVAWFLEKGGHSTRVVTSYAAAREALREQSFSLMLADLELGTEDGRVELPRLEAEGLLPRTIVVSGYLDEEVLEGLRRISAVVGTVSKPFEPAELLQRVDEVVASDPEVSLPQIGVETGAPVEEESTPQAAELELEEEVILTPPSPKAGEPRAPKESETSVTAEDGWVEIVSEERVDLSDWEGSG